MINRFTFTMMIRPIDPILTIKLGRAIKSGLKSIKSKGEYYLIAKFNDGIEMEAWNTNRYYAWLQSGTFTMPNGDKYLWNDGRPSRKVMAKFYNLITKSI